MSEIWGTKRDWLRAAESVVVAISGLAKSIVGADYSSERKRIAELTQEGLNSLHQPRPPRYQDRD